MTPLIPTKKIAGLNYVGLLLVLLGEVAYKINRTFISSRSRVPGGVGGVVGLGGLNSNNRVKPNLRLSCG